MNRRTIAATCQSCKGWVFTSAREVVDMKEIAQCINIGCDIVQIDSEKIRSGELSMCECPRVTA
jgi:hypothetical protein